MSVFLEKLNSRKLFALVMYVILQLVDPELAKTTGSMFITYILGQAAVDAASSFDYPPIKK